MPDFYASGEYDIAGFIVGVADRDKVIDGSQIKPGDELLALPSVGLHTNGYSLIRRIVERSGLGWDAKAPFADMSLGEALTIPTRIYVKSTLPLIKAGAIKGLAHITGGGLIENPPRAVAEGLVARIDWAAWPLPPVFDWLQRTGGMDDHELRRTFNCGVGLMLIEGPEEEPAILAALLNAGEDAFVIGELGKA
jgi:phosphoribosylaminoimidazole synthetase